MSNIDKQALREIAAAAVGAHERLSVMPPDDIFDISLAEGTQLDADITALNALNSAANPTTVLALLDELEAAEKRIAELEANKCKPVMFIDGDISPADADKLAAVIREFNEETETPAARMARIIRENPHPTNMCDMPAAGIGVKGVGEVTDKSPLERLQAANNENRQMVMVSVGTLKAARREILSHVAANGKGVMTDIVLNQINAVIGKG
ncbi:ead/Ea22-like family protein [Escherichia coli]|uniref:ead/Ea22-like family protein n=1 Tax=Escherichia coli TaxID=562 RepID=UPI003872ACBB